MPEYVRIRLANGVQMSILDDHPAVTAEDVTVLKDKPAVDPTTGAVLDAKAPAPELPKQKPTT